MNKKQKGGDKQKERIVEKSSEVGFKDKGTKTILILPKTILLEKDKNKTEIFCWQFKG